MCGRVDEALLRTIVEGVELTVCQKCSKFGKVLAPIRRYVPQSKPVQREERVEVIVEDYSDLVKKKRESLGISQKDFALKISEKESTLHKIETGHFEPSLSLARKLEKMLGIRLVKVEEDLHIDEPKKRSKEDGFTLGDFIKTKR